MLHIQTLLTLFGPLAIICGLLYWAGSKARNGKAARALRLSGGLWFVGLGLIYLLVMVAIWSCDGNIIFGYVDCTGLGPYVSDAALPLFVFGTLGGIGYGILLVLVCGILEWRTRRG
ncbi:hypothetical protein LOM8899_03323 [Flavimaricola marinus]|uniref:Uncharacterized protein n=2 Tax=Flavimaricola marinus TaxID=1819565 RepID=A0A238LHN3_9RHOB|nr:hypothetical protein LOM8899_03323 [Flavimaricola marinus]